MIVSRTKCDACGKEIDHLKPTWLGMTVVTRGLFPDQAQHACDAACFVEVLQKVNAAVGKAAIAAREAKAAAAKSAAVREEERTRE